MKIFKKLRYISKSLFIKDYKPFCVTLLILILKQAWAYGPWGGGGYWFALLLAYSMLRVFHDLPRFP